MSQRTEAATSGARVGPHQVRRHGETARLVTLFTSAIPIGLGSTARAFGFGEIRARFVQIYLDL